MKKQDEVVLMLDPYEQGVVISALNEMRSDMLKDDRPTDTVDDVLLRTIDAPHKKAKWRDEAR